MRWSDLKDQPCSVARSLSIIGDRWALLILRDCFLGVRRFDHFQSRLGATRHVLSNRLKTLVRAGVLARKRYQERPARFEYRLTAMGLDLYPVIVSLTHWGDRWLADRRGPPLALVHTHCGATGTATLTCAECHQPFDARSARVEYRFAEPPFAGHPG